MITSSVTISPNISMKEIKLVRKKKVLLPYQDTKEQDTKIRIIPVSTWPDYNEQATAVWENNISRPLNPFGTSRHYGIEGPLIRAPFSAKVPLTPPGTCCRDVRGVPGCFSWAPDAERRSLSDGCRPDRCRNSSLGSQIKKFHSIIFLRNKNFISWMHSTAYSADLFFLNPFLPTVPTFTVRETSVSRTANVGTVGRNGLILSLGSAERVQIYPKILFAKIWIL